jgi:uncharacterized membrane protein
MKQIFKIISAILLMAAGASLTFNFLNGLLLIGIILLICGIALLVHMVVAR